MTSLPFSVRIKNERQVWRVIGILTVGSDGIGVEWRSDEYRRKAFRRRLEHVGRGEVHVTVIPWMYLDAVSFHGSFAGGGMMRIRARTMNALDGLPAADGPFWQAKIAATDRSRAREFALAAESAVSSAMQLLGHRTRA